MDTRDPGRNTGAATDWLTPLRFGAVLTLLLLASYPKVLLGLHSFVHRDYGVLAYPFIQYAHESFWSAELPLWNPFSNCGTPFLAQWGTMILYPFSLFYLLFPLPWSLGFFCLAHLFLGGIGMYLLVRKWTGNSFAASVAGIGFVFNGVTLSCLMWPNYTVALGWMPWVIGFAERSWTQGGRWMVMAALAAALQMLAGVPEIAGFTWVIAVGIWFGALITQRPPWKPFLSRLLLLMVLAAGLIAIQLLPFVDLLEHSQRDRTFATGKWALPGWGWANMLVPLFHCFQTYQGPFVQPGQAFFSSCYFGSALLALALAAPWRSGGWRGWVLVGCALFGLIAALGDNGFLYPLLKGWIPLLGIARYPVKFLILPAFSLPVLGAMALSGWMGQSGSEQRRGRKLFLMIGTVLLATMGVILWFGHRYPFELDQWTATWHNAAWRAVFLIAVLSAVIFLPWQMSARSGIVLQFGILGLLALDITTHTPKFNATITAGEFEPRLWQRSRQAPPPALGESRVMISPQAERLLLFSTETNLAQDFFAKRLALWSNLNLLDGIPKVNGSSTLQLREQKQIESLLYNQTNQTAAGLIDFLAVSQRTAPNYAIDWSSRSNFCPLVTCGQEPIFAGPEETLKGLAAPDFDPRTTVYLPLESKPLVSVSNRSEATIVATHFSSQRVDIEVEAKAPALIVVAQSFYHDWHATIDGRPVPLLRANHAFQALEAPAGHFHVRLYYRDRSLILGAIISALTALACVMVWVRARPYKACPATVQVGFSLTAFKS